MTMAGFISVSALGAVFAFLFWEEFVVPIRGQRAAIADTHPKDGDAKQAPLVSGGGSEGNRP